MCIAVSPYQGTAADPPAETPVTVQTALKGSVLKIDGRMFAGIFDTEEDGSLENRTLDIPDAKLRFTFAPSKDIVIVNRFSTSRAATSGFDYFYLDLKNWGGALPGHTIRAGKMKLDVGVETQSDNPVESVLITNSAGLVTGYDEGIQFLGPIAISNRPATYSVMVTNATKGFAESSDGLATAVKLGISPIDSLYVSGSWYQTGDLLKSDGTPADIDLQVSGLTAPPTGATNWQRNVWEVDVRWNYGPTGVRPTIVSTPDTPFQLAAAIGRFTDDAVGAADREGDFWYIEGLVNATNKIYLASRLSEISLDDGATATLAGSPVAVNRYRRLSIGAGYRLTPSTQIKAEFTDNSPAGGLTTPRLNQFAVGVATKF
jgi:hypothetical protein